MATAATIVQEEHEEQHDSPQKSPVETVDPVKQGCSVLDVAVSAARHHIQRLHLSRIPRSFQRYWRRVSSWVWFWIEELFEEFQPWLKWVIFDAALTLLVNWLVRRVEAVRPLFGAVGWV